MEHLYKIQSLTYVEESSGYEKVATGASVLLTSSESFEHTYDYVVYEPTITPEPEVTTITETKTISHDQEFKVEFDISNLDPLLFAAWDDLSEDQVIAWVKNTLGEDITSKELESETILLDKKDRILNPKKYNYVTPITPWQVRAIEEQQEAAEQL